MSNLLKEAIVDARALRETALRSAEASIIEKYSDDVRSALDKILEQEDPLAATPEFDTAMGGEGAGGVASDEVATDIPLAAADGLAEEEGDTVESASEGESINVTLDLPALEEAVKALAEELDDLEENEEIELTEEDFAGLLDEEEEPLDEADEAGVAAAADEDADVTATDSMLGRRTPSAAPAGVNAAVMSEDGESNEKTIDSLVDAIMEKLTVDMRAELSGWAGRSSESVMYETERALAHRRSTDVEGDLEDLKKAFDELVFENKQFKKKATQYKQALYELKENLEDVNLSNARLLYTNRVLRNTSLNERQKDKIVEAISSAGSVTEARTIYKTLESTVQGSPKRAPQSLSEAISRPSSVIRASRHESAQTDPFTERMKKLAGIN
jgi:hypothetical protein